MGKFAYKTTTPALSKCLARIYQKDEIQQYKLLVQPTPGMAEHCFISVATSLDNANQKSLNCRIFNPSGESITLPKDTTIAYISGLPNDADITLIDRSTKRDFSIKP